MRGARLGGLLLVLALQPAASAQEKAQQPPIGWYEVELPGVSVAAPAIQSAKDEISTLPVRLVPFDELKTYLKDIDARRGLLEAAGKHLARGKEFSLGLKLKEAIVEYKKAVETLESGFARYYDPGRLAEPVLQLGVSLFQSSQKDEARKAFMRAAALAPTLTLAEGYYSPSVRKAFQKARDELGTLEPSIPPPQDLYRICLVADLKGMMVVTLERLGDKPLLKLALYDAAQKDYIAAETVVVDEKNAVEAGQEVTVRLKELVAATAGVQLTIPPPPDAGVDIPDAGPEEDPWYIRHWWIWPAAAVVIAGVAVTLPLTVFREDVVDINVRF